MIATAAVSAAVLFWIVAALPPAPGSAPWDGDPALAARTARGAFHVHTSRSDGAGDTASVAAAAARAGLDFVVLTDHGDATRQPDPPAYVAGVLVIDAVEVSTNGGHYVALGLPAAPYPLGGEASAVVEDVSRLGGFGFAAHPDSVRRELAWTDWTAPVDGLEWLNADSEWRNETRFGLLRAVTGYLIRPSAALARMVDRPARTLERWDALSATRRLLTVAGHDAHGGVVAREEGGGGAVAGVPSYDASFGSFSTGLVLEAPLSGDARRDGPALLAALRAGRAFTTVDGLASPGRVDMSFEHASGRVSMGGEVPAGTSGIFRAVVSLPPGAELVVVHNGRDIAADASGRHDIALAGEPGAVRLEVRSGGRADSRAPWLLANPIFFVPPAGVPPALPAATRSFRPALAWRSEQDGGSSATVTPVGEGARLAFALRPGARESQFVALVAELPPIPEPYDGVAFEATSDRPARISVQLRHHDGLRWARSVYLPPRREPLTVPVTRFIPADHQDTAAPDLAQARWILFVVDLTNTPPGGAGSFSIENLAFTATSLTAR